eukprot:284818947_5
MGEFTRCVLRVTAAPDSSSLFDTSAAENEEISWTSWPVSSRLAFKIYRVKILQVLHVVTLAGPPITSPLRRLTCCLHTQPTGMFDWASQTFGGRRPTRGQQQQDPLRRRDMPCPTKLSGALTVINSDIIKRIFTTSANLYILARHQDIRLTLNIHIGLGHCSFSGNGRCARTCHLHCWPKRCRKRVIIIEGNRCQHRDDYRIVDGNRMPLLEIFWIHQPHDNDIPHEASQRWKIACRLRWKLSLLPSTYCKIRSYYVCNIFYTSRVWKKAGTPVWMYSGMHSRFPEWSTYHCTSHHLHMLEACRNKQQNTRYWRCLNRIARHDTEYL